MSKPSLSTLADALGVVRAAHHVLNADALGAEEEAFLREHHRQLPAEYLLCWLGHEDPGDAEIEKPIRSVVDRIVEQLGETGGLLLVVDARSLLGIRDENVRDDIIERLRPVLGDGAWLRLALLATGGRTFRVVRDLERDQLCGDLQPPAQLLDEGLRPSLVTLLFADRRDEAACTSRLREALRDSKSRLYTLWLLGRAGLLPAIGTLDAVLGDVPALAESDLEEWPRIAFQLGIARSWPDHGERKKWVIRHSLGAASRGVSWGALWWEIDPALRDEVALASFPTSTRAAWIMGAVVRRLSGRARWRAVFALLRAEPPDPTSLARLLGAARGLRLLPGLEPTAVEIAEARNEFDPRGWDTWLELPLPEDADDVFDDDFVNATIHRGADFVIGRLLTLPLVQHRASRILELALDHHKVWQIDRLEEIGAITGRVDRTIPLPTTASSMTAYRLLAGRGADERIREAIDEAIDRSQLYEAIRVAQLAPELVSCGQRSGLHRLAKHLPISELALLQADHPWLLSPNDVVAEAANQERSWGLPDRLPAYLLPVMEAKSAATDEAPLAVKLLDRMEELGAPRRQILGIAVGRLARRPEAISPTWLSRRLDSKALWEDPGTEVISTLLREPTSSRVSLVLEVCHGALRSDADLCAAMHTALGRVFVRIAKQALKSDDAATARNALTALAHLTPAPRIRGTVLALRNLGVRLDAEIDHLIGVNADLLRRGSDTATESDIGHALAALAEGRGGEQ